MAYVPRRWHWNALLGCGVVVLVGGPFMVLNGVRALDRGTTLSTVGGWLMVVGGVLMALGGVGMILGVLRRKPSE
jgi:hypothetical protein